MDIKISPSILAADISRLAQETQRMRTAGAEMLHVDIMDGHFVPNLSFGLPVLNSLDKTCDLPMDVHLMITHPHHYIQRFVQAGADIITIHEECDSDTEQCIRMIHDHGAKAGICIKPKTPVSVLEPYLPLVDMVLIMTVEPGFGGQSFMQDMMDKVRKIRQAYPHLDIEIDGGINDTTAKIARDAGANVLVTGSFLFGAKDVSDAMTALRGGAH